MKAWLRMGLGILGAVYLAILAAGLAMISLGPVQTGWPALLREMFPFLFVPVLPLLVLTLVLRARFLTVALLLPAALVVGLYGPSLSPRAALATNGPSFRILTFNVGAARRLEQPDAVIRAIRVTIPDVVCLVEARSDTLTTVGLPLRDTYPYQISSEFVFILSRFPLTDPQAQVLRAGVHDSLQASVEIDHRLISLTAVHLRRTDSYPGLGHGIRPLLGAIQGFSTEARDQAVIELASRLHDEGGTRVLVGDFNMTPTSASYQVLADELQDAFPERGWGPGHTYPATLRSFGLGISLPLIRIDYVFHSRDLVARGAWVGPISGSDHLPVVVDLEFR